MTLALVGLLSPRFLLARCQQGQSRVTLPARQLLEISWLA